MPTQNTIKSKETFKLPQILPNDLINDRTYTQKYEKSKFRNPIHIDPSKIIFTDFNNRRFAPRTQIFESASTCSSLMTPIK